jgi:hypothetical protein
MRFGKTLLRALLLASFATLSGQAGAQVATRHYGSGEISLVRVAFTSGDFRKDPASCSRCRMVEPGMGFDVMAIVPAAPPLMLAGGVQYSSHTTDSISGKLGVLQLYLEPRLVLSQRGRLIPYFWGRIGFVHASQQMSLLDDDGEDISGNGVQTGPAFGAGAGLLIQATAHVRANIAAGMQRLALGNIDFDYQKVDASSAKGMNLVIRAGISLEFSPTSSIKTRLGW